MAAGQKQLILFEVLCNFLCCNFFCCHLLLLHLATPPAAKLRLHGTCSGGFRDTHAHWFHNSCAQQKLRTAIQWQRKPASLRPGNIESFQVKVPDANW